MARVNPGGLFVIVVLLLLLANPGSNPASLYGENFISNVIAQERASLLSLNTSTYGLFNSDQSVNLTGLREDDGFYWDLMPSVQNIAKAQQSQAGTPLAVEIEDGQSNSSLLLYQNVTGWARGSWVRGTLNSANHVPPVNQSSVERRIARTGRAFTHNITGSEGKVFLSLKDRDTEMWLKQPGDIKSIYARLTIQDVTSFADGWVFLMHGIQNLRSGSITLTTTSDDFAGIFALPHFALSQTAFGRSLPHIIDSLSRRIDDQAKRRSDFSSNPWGISPPNSADGPFAPQCELIAYFQQHPIIPEDIEQSVQAPETDFGVRSSASALEKLEKNLRLPSGLHTPSLPDLHFSATLFSPDCGYLLLSKGPPEFAPQDGQHLKGPKYEIRIERARAAMVLFAFTIAGQLGLLIRQINESNTPSKRSRISFGSLLMMSLGTAFISFAFLVLSTNVSRLFVIALSIAFLAFMDGLFFQMRFLLEVWTVQAPERLERQREVIRNDAAMNTASETNREAGEGGDRSDQSVRPQLTGDGAAAMPLPLTNDNANPAPTPTTPNQQPTFGSLYTRYCLFLSTILFISIWAAFSWPRSVRSFYANALVFAYLSFWTPQIHRNIMRNCRKAFSKRFVIGQSVFRFFPVAYLWGYEGNVLFVDTDSRMLIVFAGWLWIQIVVMTGQEIIGPRFFVSEHWSWIPPAWEYHPVLREDEEGATLPLGYSSLSRQDSHESSSIESIAKSDGDGHKTFDCAICMQQIRVAVVPSGESPTAQNSATAMLTGGFMNRRHYSVTPCRHIFHSACLEGWIGYRLQCPICREALPPL